MLIYDSKSTWSYLKTEYNWNPTCGFSDENYAHREMSRVDTGKLPPERRVKPVSPLDMLTPRERQYTVVNRSKVLEKSQPENRYARCPQDGRSYLSDHVEVQVNASGVWDSDPPAPNWALALRLKIQDDKVSFADSIGEWRESVKLVEDGASILKKSFRAARRMMKSRRKIRELRRWFRSVFGKEPGSKWELQDAISMDLAIKFGLEPTANLLWDTASQIDRYLLAARRIQVTLISETPISIPGSGGGAITGTATRSCRAIAYVRYDMNNREFTTGNLAESLWAGIPCSFMVDWFWNIGSYLSSFNAMNGVTELSGVLCTRISKRLVDTQWPYTPWYYGNVFKVITPGLWSYRSYERSTFYSLPIADFVQPRLPDSELWSRLFSAVEVLKSIRHGR